MKNKIRIGCGAGFAGDRLDPALVLAEHGELDFLVLECLAERTIALAQKRKLHDPMHGYDPMLERRMELLMPLLLKNKICLITNMGAANPAAAADTLIEIARAKNVHLKVAAVLGDDVLSEIDPDDIALETGKPLRESGKIISANAYMGVEGILEALKGQPDIIITGRVADPSLFLAPMIHAFGWSTGDYELLGKGTVVGHLMECAGQITGGYFADPGKKEVPDMENLGHPFADVFPDGSAIISKVNGTGGIINLQTAKEQLLYEVVNPYEYYTPDVVADFSSVTLKEIATDTVHVTGGSGKQKPESLKVSVGYNAFYMGEGEITYAGSNAVARAKLAAQIIEQRLMKSFPTLRSDLVGLSSVHGIQIAGRSEPYEVRLRMAARAATPLQAARIGEEVEALYTNGPAGGGGVRKYVTDVVGIVSVLIKRAFVQPKVIRKAI